MPIVEAVLTKDGMEFCRALHRWLLPSMLNLTYRQQELAKKMYVNIGCGLGDIKVTPEVESDLNRLELYKLVIIKRGE